MHALAVPYPSCPWRCSRALRGLLGLVRSPWGWVRPGSLPLVSGSAGAARYPGALGVAAADLLWGALAGPGVWGGSTFLSLRRPSPPGFPPPRSAPASPLLRAPLPPLGGLGPSAAWGSDLGAGLSLRGGGGWPIQAQALV